MEKVTYKILTRSLNIRNISSFQFTRLYIWKITGNNFYLIVLVYKNITCKIKSKCKEIQLYAFKILLKI